MDKAKVWENERQMNKKAHLLSILNILSKERNVAYILEKTCKQLKNGQLYFHKYLSGFLAIIYIRRTEVFLCQEKQTTFCMSGECSITAEQNEFFSLWQTFRWSSEQENTALCLVRKYSPIQNSMIFQIQRKTFTHRFLF